MMMVSPEFPHPIGSATEGAGGLSWHVVSPRVAWWVVAPISTTEISHGSDRAGAVAMGIGVGGTLGLVLKPASLQPKQMTAAQ